MTEIEEIAVKHGWKPNQAIAADTFIHHSLNDGASAQIARGRLMSEVIAVASAFGYVHNRDRLVYWLESQLEQLEAYRKHGAAAAEQKPINLMSPISREPKNMSQSARPSSVAKIEAERKQAEVDCRSAAIAVGRGSKPMMALALAHRLVELAEEMTRWPARTD